jgi:hypothetical protein
MSVPYEIIQPKNFTGKLRQNDNIEIKHKFYFYAQIRIQRSSLKLKSFRKGSKA